MSLFGDEQKQRVCVNCREEKPLSEFRRCNNGHDGMSYFCNLCRRLLTESERTRIMQRHRYHSRGDDYKRSFDLKRNYNISTEQYAKLLEAQGGKCAICGCQETKVMRGKVMYLAVDHCHKTGKIRGLLCNGCNTGIGALKDDPSVLRRAEEYVSSGGFTESTGLLIERNHKPKPRPNPVQVLTRNLFAE